MGDSMRLEIDGRYSNIKFSACHFITDHFKCGRLHGHVYVLRMKLHGEKADDGMIMDFITLKKVLRNIASEFDHRVMLPGNSPKVSITMGDEVVVESGDKRYVFPKEDVVIMNAIAASAEEVARVFLERILEEIDFPDNISIIEVGVDEERGQSAWITRELR